MTARFKFAYDALCEAFFNGTLAKGTCMACACGNIVAKAAGFQTYVPRFGKRTMDPRMPNWWCNRLISFLEERPFYVDEGYGENPIIEKLTGYNRYEMVEIENAF